MAALIHGLGLVALAAALGGLVLDRLILPADASDELAIARDRLRRFITACLIVLAVTTLGDLLVRAQVMSRGGLAVILGALPELLARTHFGTVWIARSLALALAVVLSRGRSGTLRTVCLLLTVAVVLTTSLTRHAADWGDLTLSVAADWTHAVAASAWTGGLLALAAVVIRRGPPWPPALLGILARRFSRLAGACLLAVLVTGSYAAWVQVATLSALWTTAYGRVLAVKVLFVAVLVGLGAVNRYVIVPGLDPGAAGSGAGFRAFHAARRVLVRGRAVAGPLMPSRFSAYVAREALVVLVVFACTAVLGESTPARQVLLEPKGGKSSHSSANKVRRESRAARPFAVVPPPGDSARGRAIFEKLACFDCHAVPGERFPAPRRPGPDLSGVGLQHPGYLAESLLNPNAMIVDGPGYTDDRGLSTMPTYTLAPSELSDLVSYLKTLNSKN